MFFSYLIKLFIIILLCIGYREDTNDKIPVKTEPQSQEIATDQPPVNNLIQLKQESIKNELPKPKKRRQINL